MLDHHELLTDEDSSTGKYKDKWIKVVGICAYKPI